jgi:hypothetical protein
MQALTGRGSIAPTHSWLRKYMWEGGQRHVLAALYPRWKCQRYPLHTRLGGPQSWSGHKGYRKNYLSLPGIEPRSIHRLKDKLTAILKKRGVRVWIGFIWLRVGSHGGMLWTRLIARYRELLGRANYMALIITKRNVRFLLCLAF